MTFGCSIFSHKTGIDISKETICINGQSLFCGNRKKNIIVSTAKLAQRAVKIKVLMS